MMDTDVSRRRVLASVGATTAAWSGRWDIRRSGLYSSTGAASGPTVYYGSRGGSLVACDAESGNEHWQFPTGGIIESVPLAVSGIVYVGTNDGELYAVDAADGSERWVFDEPEEIKSGLTAAGGVGYFGAEDGLYAVDLAGGELEWAKETARGVRTVPSVLDGEVIIGTELGNVYSVDAEGGDVNWELDVPGPVRSTPTPIDGEDDIYLATFNGDFRRVDPAEGGPRWECDSWNCHPNGAVTTPVVEGELVYFGAADGNLYAVPRDNNIQEWVFSTSHTVRTSPAVANGSVYIGSDDTNLYSVDAESGDQEWFFASNREIQASPTVASGRVYFGSLGGRFYAVDASTGDEVWRNDLRQPIYTSGTVVADPVDGGSIDSRAIRGTTGHNGYSDEVVNLDFGEYSDLDGLEGEDESKGETEAANREVGGVNETRSDSSPSGEGAAAGGARDSAEEQTGFGFVTAAIGGLIGGYVLNRRRKSDGR